MTFLSALGTLLVGVSVATSSIAAPPTDIIRPDPELQAWFQSLRQPGPGYLCCSISDCHFVEFWVVGEHYEVEIDGGRYVVPSETVIQGIANPTGRAVACYAFGNFRPPPPAGMAYRRSQDLKEILCFVPPRPPS